MECYLSIMLKDVAMQDFYRVLDFVRSYGGSVFETSKNILTVFFDDVNVAARVMHSLTKNFTKCGGGISLYPGLAQGLAKIAKPGEILLAEEVIQPLMSWVEITSMGMLTMEGMQSEILVYSIDTLKKDFELKPQERYPLIIKEEELKQLGTITAEIYKPRTCLVEIYGPEGIGKTTLVNQLHDAYPQFKFIVGNCYNFIPHLTFAPFLEILARILKIEIGDNSETIHKKIEEKIKALDISDIATAFYFLTDLFGVSEEDNIISKLDTKMKETIFTTTIREVLVRESWDKGLILVFEDIDHIDTSSMRLLRFLINEIKEEKIMFIVTSEFRPRLKDDCYTIEVLPLKSEDQDFLIRKFITDEINIPPATPLHLYQYLRLYEETSNMTMYRLFADETKQLSVPLSFGDLASIIDRRISLLDPDEQKILQNITLLGMEVNTELVNQLFPQRDFFPILEKAVELGFLQRKFGHYRFSHRVIHQRFYETIEDKKSAHSKMAQFYEKINRYFEHIAFHHIQAEEYDEAIGALQKCALYVKRLNGWDNAIEYLTQALEFVRNKIDQGGQADVNLVISLYEQMGDLYREMGDEENALRYYRLVLDGYKDILK